MSFDSAGTYKFTRFYININSTIEFSSIILTFTALENNDENIDSYYDYTIVATDTSTNASIGQVVFNSTNNYNDKEIEFVENSSRTFSKTTAGNTEQNFEIADLTITLDDTYAAAGTYSANVICSFTTAE